MNLNGSDGDPVSDGPLDDLMRAFTLPRYLPQSGGGFGRDPARLSSDPDPFSSGWPQVALNPIVPQISTGFGRPNTPQGPWDIAPFGLPQLGGPGPLNASGAGFASFSPIGYQSRLSGAPSTGLDLGPYPASGQISDLDQATASPAASGNLPASQSASNGAVDSSATPAYQANFGAPLSDPPPPIYATPGPIVPQRSATDQSDAGAHLGGWPIVPQLGDGGPPRSDGAGSDNGVFLDRGLTGPDDGAQLLSDGQPSHSSDDAPSLLPASWRSPPESASTASQQSQPQSLPKRSNFSARASSAPVRSSNRQDAPFATYGALRAYLPTDQEMAELRRQQAAQGDRANRADIQNSWFAAPALLPPLVGLGLEGATLWAGRQALPTIAKGPLDFIEREPYLRVGDNWATRAGRRAHAWLKDILSQKDGWNYEPKIPGQPRIKPDVGTPQRDPADPAARYYLELKPDTPTGRAAAARAVKRYEQMTGRKVRAIFYDPKDFI